MGDADAVGSHVHHDGRVHHRDGLLRTVAHLGVQAAARDTEGGHVDAHHHLVGGEVDGAKAGDELLDRHHPLAAQRLQAHRGAEGDERRDGVVGRAGGDDVAGNGGPVAQRGRADLGARLRQRQHGGNGRGIGQQVVVGDPGAEVQHPVARGDAAQVGEARDVEQRAHTSASAAVHLEQQVGSPCDDAHVVVLGEHGEGMVEARRGQVAAGRRSASLHGMELHTTPSCRN